MFLENLINLDQKSKETILLNERKGFNNCADLLTW